MQFTDMTQILIYIVALVVLTPPLGAFMARVLEGQKTMLTPVLGWIESLTYRVAGVDEREEMDIDLNKREISVNGEKVHLTLTELNLLRALVKARGQVVSQEALLTEVWGPNATDNPHYLRIYIGQLRKSSKPTPQLPSIF